MYQRTQAKVPAEIGRYDHIALKLDETGYAAMKARQVVESERWYCSGSALTQTSVTS